MPADEWPPAAAADLREIPQEDWNTWVQELESKRLAPVRLEAWQWEAQFSAEDRTLSGEFRWNIARAADHEDLHLLPLGEFSAAISGNQLALGFGNARWNQPSWTAPTSPPSWETNRTGVWRFW